MKQLFIFSIISILFITGCKKEETEEIILRMYLKETTCANPWETLPNNPDYIPEVEKYLNENGIVVNSIVVKRYEPAPVYGDCKVNSGRRIEIELLEKYAEKAISIGFIEF